jgi:hypothetical protein
MSRTDHWLVVPIAAALPLLAASVAYGQAGEEPLPADSDAEAQGGAAQALPADYAEPLPPEQEGASPPIPPYVDSPPVMAQGGGYCFDGPHPVDSRVVPGATWDNSSGRHIHPYPPFDLRLFSFQNGCYYFIGDPTDFGYAGTTYSYYGAHPILGIYGGGWCFMIGPHHHFWRPWSTHFALVGPWYYWDGPYDPFFWTYWPFFHFYYRHHYPHYYARGAFFRGRVVAPRITSVPRPMARGNAGWRGPGRGFRSPSAMPRGRAGAPGAMRRGPAMPRGAAPRGSRGFTPRGYAPPAARGGGGFTPRNFSPPASRGNFTPRGGFGGGSFGGGRSGGFGRGSMGRGRIGR